MREIITLLLMVTITMAFAQDPYGNHTANKREKRELLLRSKRRWVLSTIDLVEEDPGPFPKHATQMFNSKAGDMKNYRFKISGMGVDKKPLDVFKIDENTGVVTVLKSIDREVYDFFHINFDILDKDTGLPRDRTLSFDVAVQDINDNAPYFKPLITTATVEENTFPGYLPVKLNAFDIDKDRTENSTVTISILSQEPNWPEIGVEQFEDHSKTGHLVLKGCFDYDKAKSHKLIVQVTDHGKPPLSSTGTVLLEITDANNNAPVFKEKEYHCEMKEEENNKELLRLAVDDADTPDTPAWRAEYFFIKGNENGNYKLETDPTTNEGILTVVKAMDFETTTFRGLEIGVKNEENLFVCGAPVGAPQPTPNSVNITVKVIDVNDPPVFKRESTELYVKEEEEPGKVLHTPKVHDIESNKIRFELVDDPADWVTIDENTGEIKSKAKMDRESPHVDDNNVYKVLLAAIDDGEPPSTATATVLFHLSDVNDNSPKLVNNNPILCGNKADKISVPAEDVDEVPFSGPFTFHLGSEDEKIKEMWELDPANGYEAGLVSLKHLPYGNYTVPFVIQDQQGNAAPETKLVVTVCNCGDGDECLDKVPHSSALGAPAIGLLFLGLLMLLLLLVIFTCVCGAQDFKHMPILQGEGNQTLIKYNEEGGNVACTSEPTLFLPANNITETDGTHLTIGQMPSKGQVMVNQETRESYRMDQNMMTQFEQHQRSWEANGTMRSHSGQAGYATWGANRTFSNRGNAAYTRSFSMLSDQNLGGHINRKLYMVGADNGQYPMYKPHEYAYEGHGSKCQSLDELSLSNLGDDLEFLNNLGPKFKTLGGICRQNTKEMNVQLQMPY